MINFNFERVFKARGIDKPFTYLIKAGFSDNFATKIKNNRVKRIGLKELEKLCIILRCTPNDFYQWTPDANDKSYSEHPLNIIRKTDKVIDLTKTLNSIPLGELEEIEALINDKIKGADISSNE